MERGLSLPAGEEGLQGGVFPPSSAPITMHARTSAQLPNWGIAGHEWAVQHLQASLSHGRGRHAYLFAGPAGIGKTTLARAFAARLLCEAPVEADRPCGRCRACQKAAAASHPDITQIEAEEVGGVLKIEQVRDLIHTVALRPYEGRYRVGILRRFHEARPQAADALLKTLEEPPPYVVLLLTTENVNRLPRTILSRCQTLTLRPIPGARISAALVERWGADKEQAALLARLSGGRMGWAVRALTDPETLTFRDLVLDDLARLLGEGRVGRFQRAETMAAPSRKDDLRETLILWQSFWRDAVLILTSSPVAPVNADRRSLLTQLTREITLEQAQAALLATRRAIQDLRENVNMRLALEVMFLDYPGLSG